MISHSTLRLLNSLITKTAWSGLLFALWLWTCTEVHALWLYLYCWRLVVQDEIMRNYILDKTAAPYFSNIVWYIREQCYSLESHVNNATWGRRITLLTDFRHKTRRKLEDFVDELLDYFYYLHDIFNLGMAELSEVLTDHLLKCLLLPQFVGSLIPGDGDIELEVIVFGVH